MIRILPGQYRDAETGLFYNYFRDYDPQTGRYVQSDPIGLAGGVNPYLYARAQPTRHVDPLGLFVPGLHGRWAREEMLQAGADLWVADAVSDYARGADFYPSPRISQLPMNAPWHGMRHPLLTPEEGERAYNQFIDEQIQSCTLRGLGRAIHAAQDTAAAGHRGFQPWGGGTPSASHIRGDVDPSSAEQASARQRTREIIERYQRTCGCAY